MKNLYFKGKSLDNIGRVIMHKDSRFMREHPVALIALIITAVCLAAARSPEAGTPPLPGP